MKIAIVGAGAMGCLFGHSLIKAGADVVLIDRWAEHVKALQGTGLRIVQDGRTMTIPVSAATDAAGFGVMDIVMIFTKFADTSDALEVARPLVGPDTLVMTLQNGIGNADKCLKAYPHNPIAYGLTTQTSEVLEPGCIQAKSTGSPKSYLWSHSEAGRQVSAAFCKLLESAGIHMELTKEIDHRIYEKLCVNACFNALCAITDLPVGALMSRETTWPLITRIVDEIIAVAQHHGVQLSKDAVEATIRIVGIEAAAHAPSMLMDIRNGRQTEIDSLNGYIAQEGLRQGISTPVNRTLTELVKMIEAK